MGITAKILTRIITVENERVLELVDAAPGDRTEGTPIPGEIIRDQQTYVDVVATTRTPMVIVGFYDFPDAKVLAKIPDTAIYNTGIAKDRITGVDPDLITAAHEAAKYLVMECVDHEGAVVPGLEECHPDALIATYPDHWADWVTALDARGIYTEQQIEQWLTEQGDRAVTFGEVTAKVINKMGRM